MISFVSFQECGCKHAYILVHRVLLGVMASFLTTSQLIVRCVRDADLPEHSSALAWTMYWGGCRQSQAAECRKFMLYGNLRSLHGKLMHLPVSITDWSIYRYAKMIVFPSLKTLISPQLPGFAIFHVIWRGSTGRVQQRRFLKNTSYNKELFDASKNTLPCMDFHEIAELD